jgi:hypothetical protein
MFGATVERDPNIQKLRQDVHQRMADILKELEPELVKPQEEIRFISFEDALKELVALKNS